MWRFLVLRVWLGAGSIIAGISIILRGIVEAQPNSPDPGALMLGLGLTLGGCLMWIVLELLEQHFKNMAAMAFATIQIHNHLRPQNTFTLRP